MTFTVFTDMGSCSLKLSLKIANCHWWFMTTSCCKSLSVRVPNFWRSRWALTFYWLSNYSPFTWVHEQSNLSPRWFWWNGLIRAECLMPGVSNLTPRGPLSCSTYCSSNTNYTHLNQLIRVFRITRNIHASVLRQVGDQLCRTLVLQE